MYGNSIKSGLIIVLISSVLLGCQKSDSAIEQIDAFIAQQKIDKARPQWKENLAKPPKLEFSDTKNYMWLLKTNKGDIKIKLMPWVAPMHVSSTIYLTRIGFYDGLTFHRVIPDFMAQGGDPTGIGSGHPGYKYDGEFSDDVTHDKEGLLSMANAGPGTDGSQFFITFRPTPHLNNKHTIFGEVVSGMETLKAIEKAGSRTGQTKEDIIIDKAMVLVES